MASLDAILDSFEARGISLRAEGDRLRVAPARILTDADRATIAAHKPRLLDVAAYRDALHRLWTLMAEGSGAPAAECAQVLQDVVRRLDDVGEPTATRLRRRWAEAWTKTTGRCPNCAERGPVHDPEAI